MPLAVCVRPIFDGRNPARCKLIERGEKMELQVDEEWPGAKDLSKHFEFVDEGIKFKKKLNEPPKEVPKKKEKKVMIFKCKICGEEFNAGFKLGKHKKTHEN